MKYPLIFSFWPSSEAGVGCVSCVSYLPLIVRALGQICVACVACFNENKFEHVRIFESTLQPPLRQLVPLHAPVT